METNEIENEIEAITYENGTITMSEKLWNELSYDGVSADKRLTQWIKEDIARINAQTQQ